MLELLNFYNLRRKHVEAGNTTFKHKPSKGRQVASKVESLIVVWGRSMFKLGSSVQEYSLKMGIAEECEKKSSEKWFEVNR